VTFIIINSLSKDEFEIECPGVGSLEKIKIGHNNKGVGAGWYLNKVIIDDLGNNKVYEFIADRWLAEDEDDGKTNVFLYPSNGVTGQKADPGVPYTVSIFTGDKRNAGTSAKVFIELFGATYGNRQHEESSGRIDLVDGKFERGLVDKLVVESPKLLSPLSQILIGHDNSGSGAGWFLDRVEVECSSTGLSQVFPCEKWLAKDEADGRIERFLKENTSLRRQSKAQSVWSVWVYTSDLKMAGTDANVFICMYGEEGKTDDIPLRNKSDNFETAKCDTFKIETEKIGTPYKMRVWHDNKGLSAGWHLDKIEVENMQTKER